MKKLYSSPITDGLYSLQYFVGLLKSIDRQTPLELSEHIIERGTGYFYCSEYDEVGEVGNCGKRCDEYEPRNGKSGICKHHRPVYDDTGNTLTIYK